MDAKSLAAMLNGREYGSEMSEDEHQQARKAGLVVVFGASDDLMEFRGMIYDEKGCYDGGEALIDAGGKLIESEIDRDDSEVLSKYGVLDVVIARAKSAKSIEAVWSEGGYSWQYKTDIPHETFEIMEDGEKCEKYCKGIVFKAWWKPE